MGSPVSQVFPILGLDGSCAQGALGRAGFVSPRSAKPSTMFTINPQIDSETLLAHACESLASASVMANDLAGFLEGTHRNTLLGIAQVIMLGELAVNRALDQVDRPGLSLNTVGASLLAMAVLHSTSMPTDMPLSRAGSLPQWIVAEHKF